MAFPRIGGPGASLDLSSVGFNQITLQAGETWYMPSGQFQVIPGPNIQIQTKDPVTGTWRGFGNQPNNSAVVGSDGANWRLANLTGCPVGAKVTNVGNGYTSAPLVTPNLGNSTWTAIVGGALGNITVGTIGSNYTYPPLVAIAAPPPGGVQATATVALNGNGTLGNVTLVNQGAGYLLAPVIGFQNDTRDTTGAGAKATAALTGAGNVTAVLCTNHGTPQTAVVTLTFSGGGGASAAATAIMDFAATGFTVVGNGNGTYGNASSSFLVITDGGKVTAADATIVNPSISTGLIETRPAIFTGTPTASGNITATGNVTTDVGQFQGVPNGFVISGGFGNATTAATVTIPVGGVSDKVLIQPI